MTKLQALFVLYWRNENFEDCSWRELATRYCKRYGNRIENMPIAEGNQASGVLIEQMAFEILRRKDFLFGEYSDLYNCDLTLLNVNLKRHIEKCK